MKNAYLQKLVGILEKHNAERSYCIIGDGGDVIANGADCGIIEPHNSGWHVYFQERGTIYESYDCASERNACIKFLEMTDSEYHLAKYIDEFAE